MAGEPDLALGESSEWVLYLQQLLNQHYQQAVVTESGTFDEATETLVAEFRAQNGLGEGGHVDAAVWDALGSATTAPTDGGDTGATDSSDSSDTGSGGSGAGGSGAGGAPPSGNDGAEGAAPWPAEEEGPDTERGLTSEEESAAASVFGSVLATGDITLTEGGPLAVGGYARTLPDYITFPAGTLTDPPSGYMKWLIHELGHCWQYQQGASIPGLLWDALGADYDYGGEQGLRDALAEGRAFADFGYEEQAQIFADYFERLGGDTSAYDPYMQSVRDGAWESVPATP